MKRLLLVALAVCSGTGAGCPAAGDDDPAPYDPVITALEVRPPTPTVAVGRRIQLVAQAMTEDGFSYDQNSVVSWRSADDALLTVNEVGIAQGLGARDVVVTVTHPDGPTAEVAIHVIASDVEAVEVTPNPVEVERGGTAQLTATARLRDGTSEDVTDRASWACNNLAAARVGDADADKGVIRAVEVGQATVAATFLGIRGTTSLNVPPEEGQ